MSYFSSRQFQARLETLFRGVKTFLTTSHEQRYMAFSPCLTLEEHTLTLVWISTKPMIEVRKELEQTEQMEQTSHITLEDAYMRPEQLPRMQGGNAGLLACLGVPYALIWVSGSNITVEDLLSALSPTLNESDVQALLIPSMIIAKTMDLNVPIIVTANLGLQDEHTGILFYGRSQERLLMAVLNGGGISTCFDITDTNESIRALQEVLRQSRYNWRGWIGPSPIPALQRMYHQQTPESKELEDKSYPYPEEKSIGLTTQLMTKITGLTAYFTRGQQTKKVKEGPSKPNQRALAKALARTLQGVDDIMWPLVEWLPIDTSNNVILNTVPNRKSKKPNLSVLLSRAIPLRFPLSSHAPQAFRTGILTSYATSSSNSSSLWRVFEGLGVSIYSRVHSRESFSLHWYGLTFEKMYANTMRTIIWDRHERLKDAFHVAHNYKRKDSSSLMQLWDIQYRLSLLDVIDTLQFSQLPFVGLCLRNPLELCTITMHFGIAPIGTLSVPSIQFEDAPSWIFSLITTSLSTFHDFAQYCSGAFPLIELVSELDEEDDMLSLEGIFERIPESLELQQKANQFTQFIVDKFNHRNSPRINCLDIATQIIDGCEFIMKDIPCPRGCLLCRLVTGIQQDRSEKWRFFLLREVIQHLQRLIADRITIPFIGHVFNTSYHCQLYQMLVRANQCIDLLTRKERTLPWVDGTDGGVTVDLCRDLQMTFLFFFNLPIMTWELQKELEGAQPAILYDTLLKAIILWILEEGIVLERLTSDTSTVLTELFLLFLARKGYYAGVLPASNDDMCRLRLGLVEVSRDTNNTMTFGTLTFAPPKETLNTLKDGTISILYPYPNSFLMSQGEHVMIEVQALSHEVRNLQALLSLLRQRTIDIDFGLRAAQSLDMILTTLSKRQVLLELLAIGLVEYERQLEELECTLNPIKEEGHSEGHISPATPIHGFKITLDSLKPLLLDLCIREYYLACRQFIGMALHISDPLCIELLSGPTVLDPGERSVAFGRLRPYLEPFFWEGTLFGLADQSLRPCRCYLLFLFPTATESTVTPTFNKCVAFSVLKPMLLLD
ncbi:hypothetical protein GMRT_13695 [Giardia muris]|uniref:Uncharacterized protein n=1 Tax=Giardia muris TaxID=5742 RepID=A0A4Z1TBR5_GIAMU|nr:hypothetical protein GMRT_13695 [Giardia muris]|eukprot:TNJ30687.1 hypothetical protein GMRT_13695 [Giardia muris]